jgi:hypothetical protein
MLGSLRPVGRTYTSGRPDFQWTEEPTALFHGGFYISPITGSSSLSWPFVFIIFVRLEENPSALLECLHPEALGDCISLRISLVTLGDCRYLDDLEQRGSLSGG